MHPRGGASCGLFHTAVREAGARDVHKTTSRWVPSVLVFLQHDCPMLNFEVLLLLETSSSGPGPLAADRSLAASFGRRVGGGEAGRHSGWEWGQG